MTKRTVELIQHETPLEDNIALHERGWKIQRIGWVLIFVFMILALLGVFGDGPLSKRKVQVGNTVIKFDQFLRYEHETQLKLESENENIATVSIPLAYLNKLKLTEVIPEPEKQIASNGYINFIFRGEENHSLTFFLDPNKPGKVEGDIKVNSYTIPLKQTIYP